mmetsp:Transcript_54264/g.118924  ORF Transcript_54264/g.118924 Transcript_54264/m.118924 type:complete len:204 (+) Transcript_54264:714-1325(+)
MKARNTAPGNIPRLNLSHNPSNPNVKQTTKSTPTHQRDTVSSNTTSMAMHPTRKTRKSSTLITKFTMYHFLPVEPNSRWDSFSPFSISSWFRQIPNSTNRISSAMVNTNPARVQAEDQPSKNPLGMNSAINATTGTQRNFPTNHPWVIFPAMPAPHAQDITNTTNSTESANCTRSIRFSWKHSVICWSEWQSWMPVGTHFTQF